MTSFKTSLRTLEASSGRIWRKESEQGRVETSYSWTDRQPHPNNMSNYEEWANDPEANIAFNVLTDIVAGVGYYTEMPEGTSEEHKNKQKIDDYGEDINLDEKITEIEMVKLQKGFCPVEILDDWDLKLLPPETFYIWKNKKGHIYRYTQERHIGDVINVWQEKGWQKQLQYYEALYPKEEFKELMAFEAKDAEPLESIMLFYHRKTTSRPYGKSLTEPIGSLLDERAQMNKDMPKAIHRWAYPLPVVSTSREKTALQTAFTDRDVDEAIFIGNVNPDEFKMDTLAIDPQARFIPYIELIYYQICEGLHAPLLLYLKNATEASATVMMESVDRLVNGEQRYNKRRMERYLFKPQVKDPVPRVVWGQPKTGLEDVTIADIAALCPYLAPNQQQELFQQYGIQLSEPEWPKPPPQLPPQPFMKPQPQMPNEHVLEKVYDMQTSLSIIETNYTEKRINLIKAMQMGGKVIEVHLARAYGKDSKVFAEKRDVEFQLWSRRLIGVKGKPTYSVTVED